MRKNIPLFLLFLIGGLSLSATGARAQDIDTDSLIHMSERALRQESCVEGIQYLMEAQQRVQQNYDVMQDFWINYDLGVAYFIVSEYGRALDHYYKAYSLCEKNRLDKSLKSRTLNAISGVYFDQEEYAKTIDIVTKSFREAEAAKDSATYVLNASNLALIANKQRKFDLSEHYIQLGRSHLTAHENAEASAKLDVIEAERLYLMEQDDRLLPLARRLSACPDVQPGDRVVVLGYLVEIYAQKGMMAEAERAARTALPMAKLKAKPELFGHIAEMYRRKGDLAQCAAYKDSVIVSMDSLNRISNQDLVAKTQMRLELMQQQSDTDRKLGQLIQHRRMLVLLVCICVLIAVIAILAMRNKNRQHRLSMQIRLEKEHQERQAAEYQVKETELKAAFQRQMMEQNLEQKNRELSATALFLNSRNDLLRDLIQQLEGVVAEHSSPSLRSLLLHLQQLLKSSSENDTLTIHFEKTNPDFFKVVKAHHADLSDSDIRFLSYIKMNMSTKDIAALLNVNPDSVKRRKIRMSKKLGLATSADLYAYVQGLE